MKSKIYAFAVAMLLIVTVTNSFAATTANNPRKERIERRNSEAANKMRLEQIRQRVNEIRRMDKSDLTRAEKKSMKKELKGLKKEARAMKGGVYLSVGAIIIIILVLILIL